MSSAIQGSMNGSFAIVTNVGRAGLRFVGLQHVPVALMHPI
jgi:hypothetical protein